jgi:hypothetical protein
MRFRTLVFLAASFSPAALLCQTSSGPDLPPGFVDGSKHPEAIPHYATYRLVLMHLSVVNPREMGRL